MRCLFSRLLLSGTSSKAAAQNVRSKVGSPEPTSSEARVGGGRIAS